MNNSYYLASHAGKCTLLSPAHPRTRSSRYSPVSEAGTSKSYYAPLLPSPRGLGLPGRFDQSLWLEITSLTLGTLGREFRAQLASEAENQGG